MVPFIEGKDTRSSSKSLIRQSTNVLAIPVTLSCGWAKYEQRQKGRDNAGKAKKFYPFDGLWNRKYVADIQNRNVNPSLKC